MGSHDCQIHAATPGQRQGMADRSHFSYLYKAVQRLPFIVFAIVAFPQLSNAEIYRCPAADGSTLFTDHPCHNGERKDNGNWVILQDEARALRAMQEAREQAEDERRKRVESEFQERVRLLTQHMSKEALERSVALLEAKELASIKLNAQYMLPKIQEELSVYRTALQLSKGAYVAKLGQTGSEKDDGEQARSVVQYMSNEQRQEYLGQRLAALEAQEQALWDNLHSSRSEGDGIPPEAYRDFIPMVQASIAEARKAISEMRPGVETNRSLTGPYIYSDDSLTQLSKLLRCDTSYTHGLRRVFITATDETGTYAINGTARGAAASRGWIDGYRKFSHDQMQILLQLGLSKCK